MTIRVGQHGEWYPTYKHAFAIWVIWSSIILIVVFIITEKGSKTHNGTDGVKVTQVSYSGREDSGRLSLGDRLLLSPTQGTSSPRKPSYLAYWTRGAGYPVKPYSRMLQRTLRNSPTPTNHAQSRYRQHPVSDSATVRTKNPVPRSTRLPGSGHPQPTAVPPASDTPRPPAYRLSVLHMN